MAHKRGWKGWRLLRRGAPVAAIAAAVALFVLDVTGRLTPDAFERLLVTAIAFLAIDALIERISLLEGLELSIDEQQTRVDELVRQTEAIPEIGRLVSQLARPTSLSNRSRLNTDFDFVDAREIDVAGLTLVNLLLEKRAVFESRLRDGCAMRILLLSPASNGWSAWSDTVINEDTDAHRRTALGILRGFCKINVGKCEIRDARYLLPTSFSIVDASRTNGKMLVEIIFPGVAAFERPHVLLTRLDNATWFDFMKNQFDAAWDAATPVKL